ncbi:Uncharacterised protein [Edwardsiella hoshinae]|uniref:Uncharacterized protein n=1 Tax=Edwardsiella hoshinae TaxID=93378 RepID=A0A376D5B5_9GAMM|nr:Uncharacterised protein [Edwardsiella hoshinae]
MGVYVDHANIISRQRRLYLYPDQPQPVFFCLKTRKNEQ